MLHPDTELRWVSDSVGRGVFATRDIPRGTIMWAQDPLDRVLSGAEVAALPQLLQVQADIYGFRDAHGDVVICWDLGRFVNHHCRPNSIGGWGDFDVAVRPIPAGHQVTTDYAQLNLDDPFHCRCGHRRCRGVVRPEDFEWLAPQWDARVAHALRFALHVEQPLWSLLEQPDFVEAVARGDVPAPSVRRHRYLPARPGAGRAHGS